MSDVTIKYKGEDIATMNTSGTKTLATSGKYCEGDVQVVYADPEKPTQSKTVTPTASGFTVSPDSGKVLSSVVVNGDADLIASNVRSGKNIFGVVGTLVEGITPTGTKNISANGDYDVASFATVHVDVVNLAPNTKRYTVTFASDQTVSSNVVSGDTDIAAHYLDSTFGIMFHRRGDNTKPASNNAYYGGFIQNTLLATGVYGIFMGQNNAGTIQRQSVGGNVNSLATAGGFYIRANGVIYAMCSTSRILTAGTYDVIVFW